MQQPKRGRMGYSYAIHFAVSERIIFAYNDTAMLVRASPASKPREGAHD
jgi:hypothetical protein